MRSRGFRGGFYAPMEDPSLDIRRYLERHLGELTAIPTERRPTLRRRRHRRRPQRAHGRVLSRARGAVESLVLERREILGGCAVTEEIDPQEGAGLPRLHRFLHGEHAAPGGHPGPRARPAWPADDRGASPTVQAVTPDGVVLPWWSDTARMRELLRAIRAGRLRALPRARGPARGTRAPPRAALHAGAAGPGDAAASPAFASCCGSR